MSANGQRTAGVAEAEARDDIGRRFAAALAAKDAAALEAMFGSEVDFRALTPGRTWEANSPDSIVREVMLGTWFGTGDVIEAAEPLPGGTVGGRHRIGYRLLVSNGDGRFAVEQQAYLELTGGAITWMRLVCSGFQPVPDDADPTGTGLARAGRTEAR